MTEYLFIQLAEEASQATWAALDGAGHLLSAIAHGPVADARSAADGRRVVLLVAATDVVSTQAQVPTASQARLRQILPYSLEETFAEDVEELLFAVGPRLPSGSVSAAIVAKQRLDGWLEALRSVGLVPHAVYSEADGVPDTPATLTLMLQGRRIYGRRPGQPPFVLEGFGIEQVLDLLRGGEEETPDLRHLLVYADETGRSAYQAELARLQDRLASADVKLMADGMFPHVAAALVHHPGTNLLQGPYAPKSNWVALAQPWRVAAGLLVTFGLVALLAQGVEYLSLRREDGALAESIAASCERLFSAARIATCKTEVQRRLRDAGAGSSGESFLSTLAAVAQSRDPDGRIETLSYRNRTMDLQLLASSVPALDEFRRDLEETQRFKAIIESSTPNDSGVAGRIQLVEVNK
ncbi:MAG TPA: type II secretion system protein GspL [Gammaproteobacteria bacterium]|nr:type II secretion system protein GspL [Gammaproteobacteria bacterium]